MILEKHCMVQLIMKLCWGKYGIWQLGLHNFWYYQHATVCNICIQHATFEWKLLNFQNLDFTQFYWSIFFGGIEYITLLIDGIYLKLLILYTHFTQHCNIYIFGGFHREYMFVLTTLITTDSRQCTFYRYF